MAADIEAEQAAEAQTEAGDDAELGEALTAAIRPTPLDPARPAPDLLEDLLSGIRACWLIFTEYQDEPAAGEDGGAADDAPASSPDGDEAVTEDFIRLVRIAAAQEHDRLL